jgi:hypothetical protein
VTPQPQPVQDSQHIAGVLRQTKVMNSTFSRAGRSIFGKTDTIE